eukprot:3634055-Pyramimonas_sp.AAC.1
MRARPSPSARVPANSTRAGKDDKDKGKSQDLTSVDPCLFYISRYCTRAKNCKSFANDLCRICHQP